jgi:tetratricopeptide (TPR) repeat protein
MHQLGRPILRSRIAPIAAFGFALTMFLGSPEDDEGCHGDSDCKGGRVCDFASGSCQSPSESPIEFVDPFLDGANETAHNHYKQGKAYVDVKLFDRAVAEFEQAFSASNSADLLFDIASALQLKGARTDALRKYQDYVAATPNGPTADAARIQIAKLTAEVDRLSHAAEPAPDIAANTPGPPPQPSSSSSSSHAAPAIYKRWWFWVVVAVSGYVVYEIATEHSGASKTPQLEPLRRPHTVGATVLEF